MDAVVVSDFRMEGRRHQRPLLNGHDSTGGRTGANAREDLDALAGLLDPGSSNEDGMERPGIRVGPGQIEIGLEAVDLSSERIAPNGDVETAESLLPTAGVQDSIGQHDHSRAGTQSGEAVVQTITKRLEHPERDREFGHRGRLAPRKHDSVETVEFLGAAHGAHLGAAAVQGGSMLTDIALEREDADQGSRHNGRVYKRAGA